MNDNMCLPNKASQVSAVRTISIASQGTTAVACI
jgi:hypothetical protein